MTHVLRSKLSQPLVQSIIKHNKYFYHYYHYDHGIYIIKMNQTSTREIATIMTYY